MSKLNFDPIQHPGLILNPEALSAVRQKVDTVSWAKTGFEKLIADADKWLSQDIVIPDRKGQWMHYYACSDDGSRLETVSDTEHRCPTCGKVYTGEPYDQVVISRYHDAFANAARDLGLAYQLTGDVKYVDPAGKILLGYADRYLSFPLVDRTGKPGTGLAARVFGTNLAESCWLIPMCWAYDLIAEQLTDAERQHICDDMLNPGGREVLRRDNGIHNIHCWMNSAAGCAALCSGDEELAYQTICGEYGLENQIAQGILDDGFWFECSWGYHFYTMNALWPLVEAARHIGIDVYGDRYKSFFDLPLDFAFPGLYLPPLNDSGGGRTLSNAEPYELAYARWGDPRHAGLIAKGDRTGRLALCFGEAELETEPPENRTSVNFPASGIAILRDDADDQTLVTLDYGPHGGGHGHPDKLGIILFGGGRELAPDPGSIQYGVPLFLEWFKTTLSHNTVLVDMQPQDACTGELHTFDVRDGLRIVSASADDAYPGIGFRRTVAMLDEGIVLDLCTLNGETEHTYDWAFHCRGDFSSDLPFEALGKLIGKTNGYQHVSTPQAAKTNDLWRALWTLDDVHITLVQCGVAETEVFNGVGSGNPPSEKLPMVISRRRGKQAVYASAFVVRRGTGAEVDLSVEMHDTTVRFHLAVDGETREVDLVR